MRHNRMVCFVVLAASLFVSPIANALAAAPCASGSKAKSKGHSPSGAACVPSFSYTNQDAWTGECNSGKWQSPINISHAVEPALSKPDFDGYKSAIATIFNDCNHYRILVSPPQEGVDVSTLKYGGRTYKLKEFHFHEPAENTINGSRPLAMEVHLVHETIDNPKVSLVVAVLVEPGAANRVINILWAAIPPSEHVVRLTVPINAKDLLPANKAFYT